jgi:predicted phosphodiesterase
MSLHHPKPDFNYYLVVSDIHQWENNVNELIDMYQSSGYNLKAVLDCGDHEDNFYTDKKISWYFVMGNHENKEIIEEYLWGSEKNLPKNLHLLSPGNVHNIDGLYVTGFGGNFSEKSWFKKQKRFYHITPNDFKKVKNIAPNKKKLVDVLLMHESSRKLWERYKRPTTFGHEIFGEVISQFPNVKYVFSGHYHFPYKSIFNNENGTKRYEISLGTPKDMMHVLLAMKKNENESLRMAEYENYIHNYNKRF